MVIVDGIVGLSLCKLAYFFQDISVAVSILNLVVIAIDRYRGIVFPLRPAIITPKRCKVLIPLVWIISIELHSSYLYIFRLLSTNNTTFCIFDWEPALGSSKNARTIHYNNFCSSCHVAILYFNYFVCSNHLDFKAGRNCSWTNESFAQKTRREH